MVLQLDFALEWQAVHYLVVLVLFGKSFNVKLNHNFGQAQMKTRSYIKYHKIEIQI